jgi:hypothetical protein
MLRGDEANYTHEALLIQKYAAEGRGSVIRLGAIVFFSTDTGDAWMLDVNDGSATCLARDREPKPIPIHETSTKFTIKWDAHYRFEGEMFIVVQRDGSIRSIIGYPTAEIQRLIDDYPVEQSPASFDSDAIRFRLRETGRNDACPCGSGKKYKKCCQPRDEQLLRQIGSSEMKPSVRRAGFAPMAEANGDELDEGEEEVIDVDGRSRVALRHRGGG